MDKRYQVFVSSTFADLKDERSSIIQTLMEMDCIPAGMELFPAADEDQFEFIKKVIDDCDYYLVVVGGRYGTTTADGLSYTEKEYEYAVKRGLRVVAILHKDPESLPSGKSEKAPEGRERLEAFRDRLGKGRLVKFWEKSEELPGIVALSLQKAIKMYPARGWVRAEEGRGDLLEQLNEVRRENAELRKLVSNGDTPTGAEALTLARMDEIVTISGTCKLPASGPGSVTRPAASKNAAWKLSTTWGELFSTVAPIVLESNYEYQIEQALRTELGRRAEGSAENHTITKQDYDTIKIQLLALGLISIDSESPDGPSQTRWKLTPRGRETMFSMRAVRSGESKL